ncbi:MAG TPA: PAS domain-containing protein [Spirochaetota bacterium]|nr:PAS domain-containing protein [Spirochaetota bacterium]
MIIAGTICLGGLSLPILIILGVTFFISCSFFFHYFYTRERYLLFFALAAFSASLYDLTCFFLYSSTGYSYSIFYQKMQLLSLGMIVIFIIWFVIDFSAHRKKKFRNLFTPAIASMMALLVLLPDNVIYNPARSGLKKIRIFDCAFSFYEVHPGFFCNLYALFILASVIYLFYVLLMNYKKSYTDYQYQIRSIKPVLGIFIIFMIVGVNDYLVMINMVNSPYLTEYGFMTVGVIMSLFISSSHSIMRLRLKKSIVDQKLAYDRLEKSELRMKSIIEHANELIFTLSTGYDITFLSPAWERMLGYAIPESIGTSWFKYIHHGDADLFRQAFDKKTAEILIEYRIRHRTGVWLWHRVTCAPVYGDNKKVLYYVGLSQDIMENMQALEALRYSEERLHNIIDNANDIIFTITPTGFISFVSPAWERSLGYELSGTLGATLISFVHEEDSAFLEQYMNELSGGGTPNRTVEFRLRHFNGSWRWHRLNASAVRDGGGSIIYFVCISQDITAQKTAAESLLESERRLEMALIGAEQGLWDWKFGSGEVVFSKSWEDLLGFSPDEIPSDYKNLVGLIHPDDLKVGLEAIKDHLDGKTPNFEAEYRVQSRTRGYIWIQVRGKIFERDESGNPLRAVGTYMDVTKRKTADEELKKSLSEKEILIREIHHRVKNNFQIIISLLNLQCANISDKNVLGIFSDYQNRIRSMALVHEKMYHAIEMSKIDFGDYARSIVNELLSMHRGGKPDIVVKNDFDKVYLDIENAIPCGLILNELVTNIFKYAFPESYSGTPEITLKIKFRQIDMIEMYIGDNGVGLPADVDVRNSDTLGLQLVKILTESQLRGSLELLKGQGAVFVITFPLYR